MRTFIAFAVLSLGSFGCGTSASILPDPVEISGTVTFADGKPVKDVQLALRPKGEGHQAGCALKSDGTFTVKAIPGEFMFYFAPLEDPKADKAKARAGMNAVPAPYRDVSVDHTVSLRAGSGNKIELK